MILPRNYEFIKQIKLNPAPTANLSPVERGCVSLGLVERGAHRW